MLLLDEMCFGSLVFLGLSLGVVLILVLVGYVVA